MMMKKILFSAMTIALILPTFFWPAGGEMVDKIVAIVNNDIILFSELEETFKLLSSGSQVADFKTEEDHKFNDSAKKEILNQLIISRLMKQKAAKLGIDISKNEVDRAVADVWKRYSMTRDQLIITLARQGISFKEYRLKIMEDIMKSALIGEEVHAKITVSDQEIKEYYEKEPNFHPGGEEFKLQQILLAVPSDADESQSREIKEKMEAILSQIKDGGNFELFAQKYSEGPSAKDGGNLGYIKIDQMISSLGDVVKALQPREVSDVIRSPLGFHIIKLLDIRGKDKKNNGDSLEEIREEIREKLFQVKTEKKLNEWLKELRDNAYIEIML